MVTDSLSDDVVSATGPQGRVSVNRTLRCTVGALAAGASIKLVIVTALRPDATGDVANSVAVSSDTDDPDTANDTATASAPVVRSADLGVTKVVDTTKAALGDTVSYRIVISNAGPSTSTGASVAEQWPADVAFASAQTQTGTYDQDAGLWSVGTLAWPRVRALSSS